MSATLLHHGHIRLLKKASKFGTVTVALTKDSEIKKYKGFNPELKYKNREEILKSIKFVKKVIPSPFIINMSFLRRHNIDYLIHGHDNKNLIDKKKLIIFKRTRLISSSDIRKIIIKNFRKYKKL